MKTIYLLVDSDCDGFCSGAIFYQYIKKIKNNQKIELIFHEQKQHGLSDKNVINYLYNSEAGFLVIPDASGDEETFKKLHSMGYKIIVLDHHEQDLKESKYAIIVNNQCSENVDNKGLSGCGVTWKFLKAIDLKIGKNYAKDYISYVALSIISVSCPMIYNENRSFVWWGIHHIHKNLKPFFDLINEDVNNINISYKIIPLINSCVRMGTFEDKKNLFYCMCGEYDYKECIKNLKSLHTKQQKISQQMAEEISENMIELNNGIIGHIDSQTTMTGLVAGKISSKYMKPVLLVHDDGESSSGSFRSPAPILKKLKESNLFTYAVGHDCAGGVSYNNIRLPLIEKFFNFLDIEFTQTVIKSYDLNEIPISIFNFCSEIMCFVGQDINVPIIHIKPFILSKKDYSYIGKSSNVFKFKKNGIEFIKFFVDNKFKEKLRKYPVADIEIIGIPQYNNFNGNIKKQIQIERIEVKEHTLW